MRLIDADERKQQIESPYTEYPIMIQIRKALKDFIDDAPTIDPIKHGKWLTTEAFPHHIYCSECSKTYIPNDRWQIWIDGDLPRDYCPHCGARMDGGEG